MESLKEQYYEKLKRIGDRCDLDNSPKPTGFDRLMEILDRKRCVALKRLAARSVYSSSSCNVFQEGVAVAVREDRRKCSNDSRAFKPHVSSDRDAAANRGRRTVVHFLLVRWRRSPRLFTGHTAGGFGSVAIGSAHDDQVRAFVAVAFGRYQPANLWSALRSLKSSSRCE